MSNPTHGGSYVRQPDGSLKKAEPDAAPGGPAAAEPPPPATKPADKLKPKAKE